ncbi:MAG TPA: hypothetical protein VMB73_31920 [Acetobacteraceae bacterium]|jgi:hypothetical protein|nr:hypothetical protein [Acetobacteraceae bacterium]
MPDAIDLLELAHEIARTASTTTDPETARVLLQLVEKLMQVAGLPPGQP